MSARWARRRYSRRSRARSNSRLVHTGGHILDEYYAPPEERLYRSGQG